MASDRDPETMLVRGTQRTAQLSSTASSRNTAPTNPKVDLHTCSVKLPYDKVASHLGYAPVVSLETACRHSVSWLEFAGYPMAAARLGSQETSHG
ncbi:hypothetical protein [Mesorhizobium sp. WSM2239]|uniref:Uncharacterized protein n=2 Tax=unclassified Mesorhizobium TaxID=325217 RepID=A0AAU8DH34_9HYPH